MRPVKKLTIAVEQLEDGLKAFFDQRYFSAIVLAGAAEELLGNYLKKHDLPNAFQEFKSVAAKIAETLESASASIKLSDVEKYVGDRMNRAYNECKHSSPRKDEIWLEPRSDAKDALDRALANYYLLFSLGEYRLTDIPLASQFTALLINQEEK